MPYEELLANAPAHHTPEFLDYLRANNRVVSDLKNWLVIENVKYHSRERPWHTAFYKHGAFNLQPLYKRYWDWEWLKKAKHNQTIPGRFHVHFYKP